MDIAWTLQPGHMVSTVIFKQMLFDLSQGKTEPVVLSDFGRMKICYYPIEINVGANNSKIQDEFETFF